MSNFAERMAQTYPQPNYIFPTTKSDALRLMNDLKSTISNLDDFQAFPEGSPGIVIYALLKRAAEMSPDLGDFNYQYQGLEEILKAAFKEICDQERRQGTLGW